MTKGKYGIYLWFYALLAFVLVFLGQTTLCALLLGFVIIAENNEWLSKQVIQAFLLSLAVSIINRAISLVDGIFSSIPFVGGIFSSFFGVIEALIGILVLILVIVAIIKVVKEKDAGIPGLSALVNKAFGIVTKKVYTQVPPQAPQQPQNPQQ